MCLLSKIPYVNIGSTVLSYCGIHPERVEPASPKEVAKSTTESPKTQRSLMSSLENFTQSFSLSCVAEEVPRLQLAYSSFALTKLEEPSLGELPRYASHAKAMSHVYKTTDALIIDSLKRPFVADSYRPRLVDVEMSVNVQFRGIKLPTN